MQGAFELYTLPMKDETHQNYQRQALLVVNNFFVATSVVGMEYPNATTFYFL
jgi:hypothetical protein